VSVTEPRAVTFLVRRYDPERAAPPRWERFAVQAETGMTVLDGLNRIKETLDATLAWRSSCRMGICGSCAMVIQGHPALACNTQVLEAAESGRLTLAPLPNFAIIRDLVPDLAPLFEKHRAVRPFIERADEELAGDLSGEFRQSPEELLRILQFTYCIKCGACLAACPTAATDAEFLGPMALAQAWRYSADSRDGGWSARAPLVARDHGVFHCHYAGECSNVCPKGVDPARAIQFLKRRLVFEYLGLWREGSPCRELVRPGPEKPRPDVPAPPPPTVGPLNP